MDSLCMSGMAAGFETELDGRDGQMLFRVTWWLLTCHLPREVLPQEWVHRGGPGAGLLCSMVGLF